MATASPSRKGGHAEVEFDDVRVLVERTVAEETEGCRIAQLPLGVGRLAHCMRYSGMAERSLDIAKASLSECEAFGTTHEEKQALRHRIVDAETWLHPPVYGPSRRSRTRRQRRASRGRDGKNSHFD